MAQSLSWLKIKKEFINSVDSSERACRAFAHNMNQGSNRWSREFGVQPKDKTRDYTDLSPELVALVRALQDSLLEKRALQQFRPTNAERPSRLELELVAKQAGHSSQSGIVSHPQLLVSVLESAAAAIISESPNGLLLTWNKGAELAFGYTSNEMIGNSRICLVPDYLREEEARIMKQVTEGKVTLSRETIWLHKDGRVIDVAVSLSPLIENGKVVRLTLVATDISERKRMQRALLESERRQRHRAAELKGMVQTLPAAVCIAHDPECRAITGNRMAYELLRLDQGSNIADAGNDKIAPFRMVRNGRAVEHADSPLQLAATRGIEVHDFEQMVVFADGSFRHLICNASPLRDPAGNISGAIATLVDITSRKNMEDQIRRLAHYDALTNLPNRTLLMDRLEQALAVSQRNHTRVGVIFMDLDRFKFHNDRFGHHFGDLLLQQVAGRFGGILREVDTVCRLGGDEFVLVLPEMHHAEDAGIVAQKILAAFNEPFPIDGESVHVDASLGIGIYPDQASDANSVVRIADKAMYRAKQAGGNCFRFYDATNP